MICRSVVSETGWREGGRDGGKERRISGSLHQNKAPGNKAGGAGLGDAGPGGAGACEEQGTEQESTV